MTRQEMENIIKQISDTRFRFEYKESKKHGNLFVLFYDEEEMGELYVIDEGSLHTYAEYLKEEQKKVKPTYNTQAYVPGPHGGDYDWCYHITQNTIAAGKKSPRNWHKKFTSRNHILPTIKEMIGVANGEYGQKKEPSDENNVLSALVSYMKQKGIVFSTDNSSEALSAAYAIMGGKSSVIFRQNAEDGLNGYLIMCYKDGEDRDRLCAALGKKWSENSEKTRPYKVQIERTEIDKAIEVLKQNPRNTDSGYEIEGDEESQTNEPVIWLISANKSFDTVRAFNELGTLDWNQGVYKLKEGDLVYIYLGQPIQKVRLKCQVIKANMPKSEIDDRKYITGVTEDEIEYYDPVSYGNTMRLTILEEFVDSDLFGVKALEDHGVFGQIRTPRKLIGETLEYFNEIDIDENILKYFTEDEIIINEAALEHEEVIYEDNEIEDEDIYGDEREVITKARVNQSKFREKLMNRYGKCALCGMNIKELLVASHIKPWKESAAKEKTSVENGLLLCPNHDKLFDKGYISFENDGSILISSLIDKENYDLLGISDDMKVNLTEDNIPFIEYHRQNKHIW